jgi:hypothetical protein
VPFIRSRFLTAAAAAALGAGLAAAPLAGQAPALAASGSSVVHVPVFKLPLHIVGHVNLGSLARSGHRVPVAKHRQGAPISRAAARSGRFRVVDPAIAARRPKGTAARNPAAAADGLTTKNVPGETGFSALGGVQQASTKGGFDLEPPDQGLCAGGGYVVEFINNALAIYDKNGAQLLAPVASSQVFGQPATDFFSDPRCYYDAPTKRWFLQEFIVGTVNSAGQKVTPSLQFEAVSNTQDPTGSYTVYSWNTTDAHTAHCPCFGDYDQLGADANGIYVTTDEFGEVSGFNGVIIYAISKALLENVAQTGIVPPVFGYRITHDPFGQPEFISPASTPPGASFAPDAEYFVESNPDQVSDDHVLVYALNGTSGLTGISSGPPALLRTRVTTERYSFPPDAPQKPGPRPLGQAFQDPEGQLQTDFDAEMEPTYAGGHIYTELDTGVEIGTAPVHPGVDWGILTPVLSSGVFLSARVAHQGFVALNDASLLYPYTAVDARGTGFLLFSLSGLHHFPSPAYIRYGAAGPTGPVILATNGAAPEDSFTCYRAFVGPNFGGCRWGDYSMGVASNGRVFMATEFVPQGFRDNLTNWGTFIWSAPAP